jgi:pullulanase/glycogen debranching enzyme
MSSYKVNGEENNDGESHNNSWNCGYEGATVNSDVVQLRERQIRNFISALFVSQGIPMFIMGDEYGHSKIGNNNTYCHDSEINWFNWNILRNNSSCLYNIHIHRHVRQMILLRKTHPQFRQTTYFLGYDIKWYLPREQIENCLDHTRLVV